MTSGPMRTHVGLIERISCRHNVHQLYQAPLLIDGDMPSAVPIFVDVTPIK